MIRTQVQLSEEQARILRELAAARHTSVAELIRQSVDNLIQTARELDVEERRRRAIAAAGRFRSGVSDISAAHDEYLAEALQE
ncbi:MAG: ribbon-helix-helix protein, CopG family [Anaerolineae bacterium]|nr:ribbon-helix-helix protein, CopG family [Anaerolineae bacterium]